MLHITTSQDTASTTLFLRGELSGAAVMKLERHWRSCCLASAHILQLDLRGVEAIDLPGKDLLRRMFSEGVQFTVNCRGPRTLEWKTSGVK